MTDFFAALSDPNVPFVRYAFIAGVLSSVAFGIIGSYVTVKRISSVAGAIAHSVLAGIGLSLYLRGAHGVQWLDPTLGAIFAALVAALVIGLASIYAGEREDSIIGSLWAIGMAVGVLFIARTSGYVDPMSYLFGNILIVSRQDLVLIGVLDAVVVAAGILLYRQLQAISFDEEFATVRGLPTRLYYFVLLILTSVTIVLLTKIVGIIMVIALLTIPAAVAGMFSRSLRQMMLWASLFTVLFTSTGMGLSYVTDLPSGSVIIVFAGAVYLLAFLARWLIRKAGRRRTSAAAAAAAAENTRTP